MSIPKIGSNGQAVEEEQSSALVRMELERHLRSLGERLDERTDEVVAGILRRNEESGVVLESIVEESFVKVGTVSTVAVARWMAGAGPEVARDVGQESWNIFGQLAAQRAAPLNEVTKRCLRWRDAAADAICDAAGELELSADVLERALSMLQRSLDVTLVRMCQSFEAERRRAHEELHRRQEELAFMATHDALTGLPNRTLILDRVEQMLVRARRNQTPVAALFVDLDNFKHINDTLGHGVGDQLLRAVAARLEAVVRDIDALGRLGGDEFVVVAEGMSLAAGPELIAERLLTALKQPFKLKGAENTRLVVTASVGVAMGDRATAEELLRDADIAMYRAKWDGKNGYVVFESGMQDAVQSRLELEMDLRDAFQKDEFFIVYQPTFNLREMVPTGMEALIRWRHPTRGVVQPDDFVPLLEETGLIVEVGGWVLCEACRQGAEWREAGREVGVAVNVAARQLDRDEFVDEVRHALSESGLPAEALTIEITETTIMANAEETAGRLASIKEIGVRVAIDDFGTGYSNFQRLHHLAIDRLKMDRSFVRDLGDDSDDRAIAAAIISMAKALKVDVVAEGVESFAQFRFLQEHQCAQSQGFLLSRALPAGEARLLLQRATEMVEGSPTQRVRRLTARGDG